jgi:hypothetical protein
MGWSGSVWRTVCGLPVRELCARLSTTEYLRVVREAFEPIPVDELVVEHYGEVLAAAGSAVRTTTASHGPHAAYARHTPGGVGASGRIAVELIA